MLCAEWLLRKASAAQQQRCLAVLPPCTAGDHDCWAVMVLLAAGKCSTCCRGPPPQVIALEDCASLRSGEQSPHTGPQSSTTFSHLRDAWFRQSVDDTP